MEAIAIELFGTPDYETMLTVLSPSDPAVKLFNEKIKEMEKKHDQL